MAEPLLSLDTLVTRPTVSIDGERYELLSPDELSILDTHRFGVWGREIDALAKDDSKADELSELVDMVSAKIMVGVPAEVFAKLSGMKRMSVIEVFTGLLLGMKLSLAGAAITAAKGPLGLLTGEKSSPGSNASTGAIPTGG